ncbi:hypothetical protein [Protaetiibacter larvae]|uniref:Uncharacterized protein n=1 Tax=Protaetiibacter larvae TaxID=2592654 RepID=A0A5C1Y6E7_9MICO|nr:hypothetical protein [Protaetiibacter larvae]QEO08889.1 hypothetical protein FLP23_01940 [Protaetiibacter larvae]
MSSRTDLRDYFEAQLPATIKVYADARDLAELEPGYDAFLQLIRTQIEPANTQSRVIETFELTVLIPASDLNTDEAALDDAFDDVLLAVIRSPGMLWTPSVRGRHPNGHPAIQLNITAASPITETEE